MTPRCTRWLVCLLLILAQEVTATERPWRMATTPHYQVLTQLSDRDTAEWMRGFDQFILSAGDILQIDLKGMLPLTVVLFEQDKDYTPYKPARPNGKTANVAGIFERRSTWSMIGMARETDSEELRRILQHEATHWLMSIDQSRKPAWFSEGIAEMFSTFERRGDKVNWAKPIVSHVLLLRRAGIEPLSQFLVQPSAIFDRDEHTEHFYAQSWAFTHFLMASPDPARRQFLFNFLRTYRTESGEATVDAVFGPGLKDVERDFNNYIDQSRFGQLSQPLKPAPEPPPLQAAPPALVAASLGFLALGAERNDLAKQRAQEAIKLDSNAPEGYRVLAYLSVDDHDLAAAAEHAREALDRGSKDSELCILLARAYTTGADSVKPNAARVRVNLYENAINLNPKSLEAYDGLAEALLAIESPSEGDAGFLNTGLRVFPGDDWLRIGNAMIDFRFGRRAAAMTTLETVLRPDSTLDPSQRSYAANLRRGWLVDDMKQEIETAMNKDDFAAARATLGRYRERIGADADMTSYFNQVGSDLELRELLAKYEVAVRARNKGELHTLAEQLRARPNLPANIRKYVQQTLPGKW